MRNWQHLLRKDIRYVVLILLPAAAALLGGLGEIYQWTSTNKWVATLNLLTVFLASIVQIKGGGRHGQRR